MGQGDLEQFVSEESSRVSQANALTESLARGSQQKPDEYAKALATAARTGVSPAWAREFGADIERRQKVDPFSIDDLVRSNPKTAKFLTEPDNAAIAHDDLDNLKKHEALFGMMDEDWIGKYKAASESERFGLLTQARNAVSRGSPAQMWAAKVEHFPGLVEKGNIDIMNRPRVKNSDGSVSTVRSMSINMNGKEVLIPTVSEDARVLSDDEAIKQYEKTGRHLGVFKTPADATKYAQALHEQQAGMDRGEETFFGRAIGAFGSGVASIGGNILWPGLQLAAELQSEILGKPLAATGLLKRDPFAGMVEETTRWRKTFDDYIKSIGGPRPTDPYLTSSILSGFQSAGQNIPTMAASIIAAPAMGIQAAANLSLNLMGLGTAGQAYGQAREQGAPLSQALPFAISQGVIEKYTELLPATKLLEGLGLNQGWKGALRLFGSQLFQENWTEQVATALQDLNEWAILPANSSKSVADYLTERPSAALQTLIATSVGTVLQTGAAKGIDSAINRAERQRNRLFFESLGQSATDSKVRQRLPERYRAFIDEAAKNGPLESISIPVEQFQQYFQSQDMDPGIVARDVDAQGYLEASMTGGDVRIPLGQFAEKIAPTEHLNGLMQDLRLGNGLTEREGIEAQEEKEAKQAAVVDRMAELVKEQENIAPIDVAIEEITGAVEGQLVAAGTDAKTARDQATLMRGVAVLANRAFPDMDPLQAARRVWGQYGLTIERPIAGFEERQALLDSFTSDPNFKSNFDDLLESIRAGQFTESETPSVFELAQRLRRPSDKGRRRIERERLIKVRPEFSAEDRAAQAQYEAEQAKAPQAEDVPFDVPEADAAQFHEQAGKLAAYLKAAGIDIAGKTNDQVFDLVRQEAGRALFQPAYHGTPHTFEQFDLSKIGTGEGAQSYGWGLYFAENPGVAESYRDAGLKVSPRLRMVLDAQGSDLAKAIAALEEAIDQNENGGAEVWAPVLEEAKTLKPGNIYTVDIPDEQVAKFLDWDKPLTDQAETIEKLNKGLHGTAVMRDISGEPYGKIPGRRGNNPMTGEEFYRALSTTGNNGFGSGQQGASMLLRKLDIPGLKYLDQGSRGAKEGTHNLVVFDPSIITDVKRNGKPVSKAEEKTFFQSGRGGADFYPDSMNKEVADRFIESGRDLEFASDQELMAIAKTDPSFHRAIREVVALREKARGGRDVALDRIDFEAGGLERGAKAPDYILGATPKAGGLGGATVLRTAFQGENTPEKLGYTKLLESGKIKIGLLEKADLSTFLHESGHFYLEVMGDLAANPESAEQVKDDYAAILKFLKVDSRDEIKMEHHEKFAQANERYLMEGEAPSPELRGVFQRFRGWLKFIYEKIRMGALGGELNEELREVFDRIYATDAEILRATQELGSVSMIATPDLVGWSKEQFGLYAKAVADEVEMAKEQLQQKLLAEYARAQKKAWRDEVAKVKKTVTENSSLMPVYLAFHDLSQGHMFAGEPSKLNTHSLALRYPSELINALPKSVHAADGNLDADTAAAFFGFMSGDELVKQLAAMVPQSRYIAGRVKQIMADRHGDTLVDGTIAAAAMEAMHNEQRLKVLRMELRALRDKVREVQPFTEPFKEDIKQGEKERAYENRWRDAEERTRYAQARAATEVASPVLYREAAKQAIDAAAPRNILPSSYLQASRKASRAAFAAMSKGDYIEAAIQKQRELTNHYLYLEATKARDEIDRIVKHVKKFDSGATRDAMAAAQIGGGEYLAQIDNILNRYEFRKVPIVQLERREALAQWVESERGAGREPVIDPVLLDESRKVNYQSVPMTELRSIYDAVRNIEHLARLKNQLVYKRKQFEFGKAKAELATAAINNVGQRVQLYSESARPLSESAKQAIQGLDAGIIKIEQLMMWLDGDNVAGPWHSYIWNPLKEAQHELNDDTKAVVARIDALYESMPKAWRNSLFDLVKLDGDPVTRTRKDLIGMALNLGNDQNREKLVNGNFAGNSAMIDQVTERLTAEDWRFVQSTWDLIETLWPKIADVQKRLTGLEPVKVTATPFTARDRGGNEHQLQGGYYPLVADRLRSTVGLRQEADIFEESYISTSTSHGFTKERTKATYPLDFNFERILTQHLVQVIKDYSHREAVLAANKILIDPEIRGVLQTTLGEKYEPAFRGWLKDIANDTNRSIAEGLDTWSRLFTATRANVVAAVMGFKATTMISQITGLAVSLDRVSPKHLTKALLNYMAHPVETTQAVYEQSGELRHRANNLDRDIRQRLNAMIGKHKVRDEIQRFAFHGIAVADSMVAVITWKGAYEQAIANGRDVETATLEADAAVRLTQGTGAVMDMSRMQRDRGEFWRAVTMFYGFYNALYSTGRDIGFQVDGAKDLPRALSRYFLAFAIPAILGDLIVLRGPDKDKEEGFLPWAARKALLAPFMTIPFLRDVANSIDSGFDIRFTPLAQAIDKVANLTKHVAKDVEKTRDIDFGQYAVMVGEAIGFLFGVPGTAQIAATGKYLRRVNEGEEEPDNVAKLLYDAAIGKRKEK